MRALGCRAMAALGALALVACACGVPTTGSPRALGRSEVPQLAPTSTTTPPPSSDLPFTVVWLTSSNTPAPTIRYAPEQANRLDNALGVLLGTPPAGFLTAIPVATRLNSVNPNPAITPTSEPSEPITVDLSNGFQETSGPDELLAIEQVVFTIACNLPQAIPHLSVSFEVGGNPLEVPVNGSPVARPVTPADYQFVDGDCTPTS